MKYYLISDLTHLPRCNVQSPRSAVGSAAHGGQPFAPPLLPPGQANSLSAYRFPLPAPGGEPFAPPRGESVVTSWFARQLQNFDKMSSCTLTLPCTMCCRAHALSRVNCTTSFAVKSGSAWSPHMFAFAEGSFAARRCCFWQAPSTIRDPDCLLYRAVHFSVMSGEICFGSFYVEETCNCTTA